MTLYVSLGCNIRDACAEAVNMANNARQEVMFDFNGTAVKVQPGEDCADIEARWQRDTAAAHEAWINSPEYKLCEQKAAEELKRRSSAPMKELANSEAEMRAAQVPWPYTIEQLSEYVLSLTNRSHDYGTCVYAMSMAAVAAFNFVVRQLGVTNLDFMRRTRHLDGPFMLIKAEDALYPQHDISRNVNEALAKWSDWIKEQAQKQLSEAPDAHPEVVAHWKRLAGSIQSANAENPQPVETGEKSAKP